MSNLRLGILCPKLEPKTTLALYRINLCYAIHHLSGLSLFLCALSLLLTHLKMQKSADQNRKNRKFDLLSFRQLRVFGHGYIRSGKSLSYHRFQGDFGYVLRLITNHSC